VPVACIGFTRSTYSCQIWCLSPFFPHTFLSPVFGAWQRPPREHRKSRVVALQKEQMGSGLISRPPWHAIRVANSDHLCNRNETRPHFHREW
jgi:hypothetical protein